MFSVSKIAARCTHMAKRSISRSVQRYSIETEPPYLDAGGPEIPEYSLVNVQMKGYDFTVLEHYGKWVHNTALNMGLDVEDSWATPPKAFIQKYKNKTLADLTSVMAPLFIEVIQAGLPQGVKLTVQEHIPEHTQVRYIPDLELRDLHKQLTDLGGPSKK
nr:39S ribosomal protein L48, mitochondrial-like [Cherax quadricarinatus]